MAQPARKDAARVETTEARIAALDLPRGGFTAPARAAALARLRDMGLATKRDEYWRYTDPAALNAWPAPEAALFDGEINTWNHPRIAELNPGRPLPPSRGRATPDPGSCSGRATMADTSSRSRRRGGP